ncbi:hypothetical protein B9Z19DRAFT_985847 [Tuber borchii]|uniref:Uncharacterized protein n=1 Tax=Tuber borchii TaxID=42251 RepID=A0A2T6ZQL2_TUBBO|nr:hypothetical protein B9Z19DRAFT_985847 [Tuber borchii]
MPAEKKSPIFPSALCPALEGPDLPSSPVILETGHTTSYSQLLEYAALWRDGSNKQVKVVLLVKLYPPTVENKVKVTLTIISARQRVNSRATRRKTYVSPPPPLHPPTPLTPLLWAASGGHDGVVKLLLEREGVSPDRPDNGGRTPLSWAASAGHDRVVRLLLGREDISHDRPDTTIIWPIRVNVFSSQQ